MRKALYLLVLAVVLVAGCASGGTTQMKNNELLRISGVTVTPGTVVAPDEIITIRMKLDNIGQEDVKLAYKNPCWKNPAANTPTGGVIAAHAGSTITGMATAGPINPNEIVLTGTSLSGEQKVWIKLYGPISNGKFDNSFRSQYDIAGSVRDKNILGSSYRLNDPVYPQIIEYESSSTNYVMLSGVISIDVSRKRNNIGEDLDGGYKAVDGSLDRVLAQWRGGPNVDGRQIYSPDQQVQLVFGNAKIYVYEPTDKGADSTILISADKITITKGSSAPAPAPQPPAELSQLDISPDPDKVTVGKPTPVTFIVTAEDKSWWPLTCWWDCNFPVDGATVSAPALQASPATATTGSDGKANLKITATTTGSIPVKASKTGYLDATKDISAEVATETTAPTPVATPEKPVATEKPKLAISANPNEIAAGKTTPVTFTVTEPGGRSVDTAEIMFPIGEKTITSTTGTNGGAVIYITAPANAKSITVTASKKGYLYGATTIIVNAPATPTPTTPLSIVSSPASVTAGTTAKLTLTVTDGGSPVEGVMIQVPEIISSMTPKTNSNGIAELQISVPDREGGIIMMTASKGGYFGTKSINIDAKPTTTPSPSKTPENNKAGESSTKDIKPQQNRQECCAPENEYCPMATLGTHGGEIGSMSNIIYDHCGTLYGKDEEIQFTPVTEGFEGKGTQLILKPSRSALLEWTLKAPSETTIANMQQECTFRFQINYQAKAETYTYIYFANPDEKNQRTYTNKDMNLRGENVANFGPVYINFETAQDQPIKGKKSDTDTTSTWTLYATVRNAGDGIGKIVKDSFKIQLSDEKFKPTPPCNDFKYYEANTITHKIDEKDDSRLKLYSKASSRFSCTLPAPKVDVLEPYRFISSADYIYTIDKELKILTVPKR